MNIIMEIFVPEFLAAEILLPLLQMNRIQISGVNIDCLKLQEAIDTLDKIRLIFTPNPEIILIARGNPDFKKIGVSSNFID